MEPFSFGFFLITYISYVIFILGCDDMKMNKKGFTLIELLAVIVILGVLLMIAVPKVTQYITNSKKNSFISEAGIFIDSVRNDATSEIYPFPVRSNDVTIVMFDIANLDKSQKKSPFGGSYISNKCYVAIVNIGTGTEPEYKYYLALQDSKDYAIPLTSEDELTTAKIVANAKNKMEVTVQSLCGSTTGYSREYAEISGLSDVQPVDADGNKINWNAIIFSKEGC